MIEIAQIHTLPANLEDNYKKIRRCIKEAEKKGVKTLIFPAFSLTGYPLADEFFSHDFPTQCWAYVERLLKYTENIAVVLDIPFRKKHVVSVHRLMWLENRKIKAFSDNSHGWYADGIDFHRYFEFPKRSKSSKSFEFGLAFMPEFLEKFYISGFEETEKFKKWIVLDAPSSFIYGSAEGTIDILCKIAEQNNIEIFYANAVGGRGSLILEGGSVHIDSNGKVLKQYPYFEESFLDSNVGAGVSTGSTTANPELVEGSPPPKPKVEWIYDALICGIRDFFKDRGLKSAVIGLSGGIDSAVVLPLLVKALGRKNVLGVLMPSQYSSKHSITDAVKSAENLGVEYTIIPIEKAFQTMHETLLPVFGKRPFDLAEENLQARIRGMILMGISNKLGHVVINNSNKSELAMGYSTLYGDLCGALSPIGDLYKTEVYELARFINRKREIIPQNSIDKAPSAELRPNQKDSDSLPEYDVLDVILRMHIDDQMSASEIIEKGFESELVIKILNSVRNNAYKRRQAPPQLRVSSSAFGIDRVMVS